MGSISDGGEMIEPTGFLERLQLVARARMGGRPYVVCQADLASGVAGSW